MLQPGYILVTLFSVLAVAFGALYGQFSVLHGQIGELKGEVGSSLLAWESTRGDALFGLLSAQVLPKLVVLLIS